MIEQTHMSAFFISHNYDSDACHLTKNQSIIRIKR